MLPKYREACNALSPPAVAHLLNTFNIIQTDIDPYALLRSISHAAATLSLLRAGYCKDAELLLGRPIAHCPACPTSPLLLMGSTAIMARLAAQLPAERGPTPGVGNTRLYDSLRIRSVTPAAARIGPRALGRAHLRPGVTVGQLLRRGMSRRRLSEAARLGWITLAEPTT